MDDAPQREQDVSSVMNAIKAAVDGQVDGLRDINRKIHGTPELGFKEFQAHKNIVSYLESLGFNVKPHAYGLATCMEAEFGSGGRLVIFNAEYDCLPEIGHACGHNLIATAALAGFIGTVAALKASGAPGRVRLLGTPAEEGGGGKLKLLEAGAYRDVDACLMVHPGPASYSNKAMMANSKLYVTFHGRAAHAALYPWQGANALDAAALAHSAVSMLRQQMRSEDKVHGVINHGGHSPNVIPHVAKMNYYCRSPTLARAKELHRRLEACFHGAAMAAGCRAEVEEQNTYFDLRPNRPLTEIYADAMKDLGSPIPPDPDPRAHIVASTDHGNVSYAVPVIHPFFDIDVEPGCFNHTPGFTAAAGTERAFLRSLECAKAMACTAYAVFTDDELNTRVRAEFEADQNAVRKEWESIEGGKLKMLERL